MTQSEIAASSTDFVTERPKTIPGKRVLLTFFIDDSVASGISLTEDVSLSYNMDPVFVYSENWVVRQLLSWQSQLDNEYILQEGYGTVIEKRDNFHKMIVTAIRSCKAAGAEDIWVSICGPQVSYNNTSGEYLIKDGIGMLGFHIRSIEPDIVAFVNKDAQFINGGEVTYPALEGEGLGLIVFNTLSVSGSSVGASSSNRWLDLNTLFDEVGAMLVVPALLHSEVKWRSQFKPTPFDINNDGIIDGTDLEMLLEVDVDVLINTAANNTDYLKYESWYAFIVYGDLLVPQPFKADQLAFEYINCSAAVAGLFTIMEDKHLFKPLINKHLQHEDVWKPILEEKIDILKDYRINPIRLTIRNGICLAGNHTFYGNQAAEDVGHLSYPLTRAHNVFLGNVIGKELELKLSDYIGKSRKQAKAAIPGVIQSVMSTKPVIKYSYELIDSEIDEITAIIIYRVLGTVSNVTTTATISNVK